MNASAASASGVPERRDSTLNEQAAVPMIVMARSQDHVEAVNSTLRNAGHPAHCTWISDIRDLGDALTQINPEMLLVFVEPGTDIGSVMKIRGQFGPEIPVLLACDTINEEVIAEAMKIGAQDVVSLANRSRLQAVVGRELRAFRLERALNSTLSSAREYKKQLQAFMAGSADAIAHVNDGIIVDANPAWLELFGCSEADALNGEPLMDLFEAGTHAALKGALVACIQGKWSDHQLRANAQLADGTQLPLELRLDAEEFDGEPCVRICVPSPRGSGGGQEIEKELKDAVRRDPSTGFLHRRYLIEELRARLAEPAKAGVRQLAYIKPDKFGSIQADIGVVASEDFLVAFAELLRAQLAPKDVVGRFGGNSFAVLVERGAARDVEAWADHLVKRVAGHMFQVAQRSFSATCTVGLGIIPPANPDSSSALADAAAANKRGRDAGGNQVYTVDKADTDTRVQAYDQIWVKHIKSALMENRFRLVQQPVASLQGEDKGMFDVLVRMLDESGKEVLPSEFMEAAERNDLMKNIDRWVIGASMSFCAARKPGRIFVRLSKDSVLDGSLSAWLQHQLKAIRIEAQRICFQITEETATQYLSQTKDLVGTLRKLGFQCALEHFGSGRDPLALLNALPVQFIKVDGSLMQGLATNNDLQQKVKDYVASAKKKKIETIAERVEDANTMAVLWQLGIEFIQGYFVNAPEEVVIGSR
ncbi:MAG TPA: EAL domain-containing protein [Steroidobacteraceae bacterium]|nr:EAL domain-containing protein [Steroidobacteraceae bacterium]